MCRRHDGNSEVHLILRAEGFPGSVCSRWLGWWTDAHSIETVCNSSIVQSCVHFSSGLRSGSNPLGPNAQKYCVALVASKLMQVTNMHKVSMYRQLCCQTNSIMVRLYLLHLCQLGYIHTFDAKYAPFYANIPYCKKKTSANSHAIMHELIASSTSWC